MKLSPWGVCVRPCVSHRPDFLCSVLQNKVTSCAQASRLPTIVCMCQSLLNCLSVLSILKPPVEFVSCFQEQMKLIRVEWIDQIVTWYFLICLNFFVFIEFGFYTFLKLQLLVCTAALFGESHESLSKNVWVIFCFILRKENQLYFARKYNYFFLHFGNFMTATFSTLIIKNVSWSPNLQTFSFAISGINYFNYL